jgi:hypothetical protein
MDRIVITIKSITGAILMLLIASASLSIAQAQAFKGLIGAKVVSARTDGHNIIIAVENVSNNDIAAAHISTAITYQDGKTGAPQWEWDLASAKTERAFRAAHHMPLLDALQMGVLRPGERAQDSLNWDLLPTIHWSGSRPSRRPIPTTANAERAAMPPGPQRPALKQARCDLASMVS